MTSTRISFFESSPIGICIVRRDRQAMEVLYANPALLHTLGQVEGITGRPLSALWQGKEADDLIRRLKSPNPPRDHIVPVENRGTTRWIKLTIQEERFAGQDAYVLWATDISASKEAEETLKRAVAQADAMAELKANFLATMSHEIRTPMQSVYGLLELIGEEKTDPRIAPMVQTAQNSASGLLEILDDILDFAKMDANKMDLDNFEVPVRTLVRGINEAMAVKIHGKDVRLVDDIAQDVPFVIIGDPKRLRQIIMNLTGNAIKFTKAGSVTIRVTREVKQIAATPGRLALRFEIIDTGMGMPEEVRRKLFQPFTQADNSTSRQFGGTGLGLSICRKLVEMMGGQIGVDSTVGKGSTFWFEIPTEEVGTDSNSVELPKLDGITILSVEDHPQGAKEIVRSLQSMGAKVESIPTYKEAIALIERRPFDVAIIDQGLPDGLGIDLIREAFQIRPFTGMIMYTVRDDAGLRHSLDSLGVTYLTKPASRKGLGEAVLDSARKTHRMAIDGPKRILIAEDTASVRDVLSRQLAKLGVEADFVDNGAKALAAVKTGQYGILLTDLHMPDVDGYDVIQSIRGEEKASGKHFPVIVLTADVQMMQRQVYLGHGFDECLLKPVSMGQLKRLLIRWGLMLEAGPAPAPQTSASVPASGGTPALDIEQVKEQMGGFDDSIVDMLLSFIDMTQPLVTRVRAAFDHSDYRDLAEAAHSLKGAARSACCTALGDAASDLQDEAEKKGPHCADLVSLCEKEFIRAADAIRALKK